MSFPRSSRPAHRAGPLAHRTVLATLSAAAVVAASGAVAIGLTPAASAADPDGVTTYEQLRDAVGGECVSQDRYVRIGGNITSRDDALTLDCNQVIDLNGHNLTLRTVSVINGHDLTVTDSSAAGGGTLTTRGGNGEPGIGTTGSDLIVEGKAAIDATGGQGAAGIGGASDAHGGGLAVRDQASISATGGSSGAGIGGGQGGDAGGINLNGGGAVTAMGGSRAAGIGGGAGGGASSLGIRGSGPVTAFGGQSGAGIGGGQGGDGGGVVIIGSGPVTAEGGLGAAGIGGGDGGDGGPVQIGLGGRGGATGPVTAEGGADGAGIGGGVGGDGGSLTMRTSDDARLTATGGPGAAGVGGGLSGNGGNVVISGRAIATVVGGDGGSGVGPGFAGLGGGTTEVSAFDGSPARLNATGGDGTTAVFTGGPTNASATLQVSDGVLNVPSGALRVDRDPTSAFEVAVGEGGVIESRAVGDDGLPTGAAGSGSLASGDDEGRIANEGAITIPSERVDEGALDITNNNHLVDFDLNADDARFRRGDDPVRLYATTFAQGERTIPTAARPGHRFLGWTLDEAGTQERLTPDTVFTSANTGEPTFRTYYAQWRRSPQPPTPPQPPVVEPLPSVDASIDGQPKVGGTLTASASLEDDVDGATFDYQWLRDGTPIAGAGSRTYRPTRADVARRVSVEVTASAPDRESSSDTSRAVAARPVVGIVGVTRVGEQLTPRVFVPEGARATYVWQTSERPARGRSRVWDQAATGSSYTLRARDAGQRVRLVVTISGPGFSRVVSYSAGRFVRR